MNTERDDRSTDRPAEGEPLQDPSFWSALRRLTGEVIDLIESRARSNSEFRADLLRVARAGASAAEAIPVAQDQHPPHVGDAPERSLSSRDDASRSAESDDAVVVVDSAGATASSTAAEPGPAAPPSLAPLFASPPATPTPFYPPQWTRDPFEPTKVAAACRMKAEACRWQMERSRRLDLGEDVSEGDTRVVERGRALDVWLWMVSPNKWRERSERAFVVVGGCYDALAEAAELIRVSDEVSVEQEASLRLLGEAQSALRAALEDYASTRRDEDQERTFTWLVQEARARQVYVEHMQLERPAPPRNHGELRRRIAAVRERVESKHRKEQDVERTFKKLEWHARLLKQRDGDGIAVTDSDLSRVAECATRLVEDARVPPSDTRLRGVLLPLLERVPQGLEDPSFRALLRILAAIQEYVDEREADADLTDQRAAAEAPAGDGADLERARHLVAGRDAVLVGGQPSELHRARLESGLRLRSLQWLRVEHHEPFDAAEVAIRRPGVGLVLLMTRWRSHRDGPAARQLCKSLEIPLVELPAGYNVRQVAHRVVEQLGPRPRTEHSGPDSAPQATR